MLQFRDLLTSKKFNSEEKKLLLIGIVQNMIYSKEFFPSNESLKSYIPIFEKLLNENEQFKDYLFHSRTLLSSRITRLLIENKEVVLDKEIINWHINFFNHLAHNNTNINKENKVIHNTLLNNFLTEREKYK